MAASSLYFPEIRVPDSEWFTRCLFYWDKVGSIIPYSELGPDSRRVDERMRQLIKLDLVVPVHPEEHIAQMPNFAQDFLTYLDSSPPFMAHATRGLERRPLTTRVHKAKMGGVQRPVGPASVEATKLTADLLDELRERGLARVERRHRGWLEVEPATANLYMAYLAARICQTTELEMDPVTDTTDLLNVFAMESPGVVDVARAKALQVLLPAPPKDVDLVALREFKERHKEELAELRVNLERACLDIARTTDPEIRRREIGQLKDDVRHQAQRLEKAMSQRGWRQARDPTALAVLTSAGAVAAAAVGSLTAGVALVPALGMAGYMAWRKAGSAVAQPEDIIVRFPFAATVATELGPRAHR